jgi:hypothetical protein
LIVSKFPLGICNTKLIELGTATTILDPLSTFLALQSVGISFGGDNIVPVTSESARNVEREAIGTKRTSCVVEVKITKPDAMVRDVAVEEISRVSLSDFET